MTQGLVNYVSEVSEPYFMTLVEKGWVPDVLVRAGARRQCAQRAAEISKGTQEELMQKKCRFADELKTMPIATQQQGANEQHYEVPSELFLLMLGPRLKYSCGLWPSEKTTLAESEEAMLELYCERAELVDGMSIVDLGCGWGSLSIFMASKYPKSKITSISNSTSQKVFIDGRCRDLGITNINVITGDIDTYDLPNHGVYDRVCSIEMFEHMKNYEKLMHKVSTWLKPGGKLFVHIFTHCEHPYHFLPEDGWMATYFFTGGTMPSDDLLLYFQKDLQIEDHWRVSGVNYGKTANAWVECMDTNKEKIMPVLRDTYGEGNEMKWFMYWRLFHIAVAELFSLNGGDQWIISHYRFIKN